MSERVVEGSRNFMIILNFVDLLEELRRRIILDVRNRNLSSGTNSKKGAWEYRLIRSYRIMVDSLQFPRSSPYITFQVLNP